MSNSIRFTKVLTAVALTASIAACNDLSPSPKKTTTTTTTTPVVTTEAPKPIAAPAPAEAPPAVATETVKPPVTVENDDDGPHPPDTLATARKLLDEKQYDKALKLATIAVKKSPKRSGAWNTLGRVQLQMGKRSDAIESFGKAIELNPKNSYAHNNLGLALIYDKRFEEAVDALEQAVEMEPVEAYMWNNLGMAYEQLDRLEDARLAYNNAVEMESDLARESLARLRGVKSVLHAKVDTENKDGTIAPTTTIRE